MPFTMLHNYLYGEMALGICTPHSLEYFFLTLLFGRSLCTRYDGGILMVCCDTTMFTIWVYLLALMQ